MSHPIYEQAPAGGWSSSPAPKPGLLGLADDADTAARKLGAAIDAANAEAASPFKEMFETNRVSASEEALGGIAPTS